MKLKTTPLSFSIHEYKDSAIFGSTAIHVSVIDDGGGPYVKIEQIDDPDGVQPGIINVNIEELQAILKAAKDLIKLHTD